VNGDLDFSAWTEALLGRQMVDLAQTIEEGMPVYPTHPQYFHMLWDTHDPANLYQLLISEHTGTHLDCPFHFVGRPGDESRVSLEKVPVERFVNRAVKLDFRGTPGTQELGAADIRRWEGEHRPLREGEAAVFYFGWDRKFARLPEGQPFLENWPGIKREAGEYLAERGVVLVGTDCLGIDGSSTTDIGTHFALLEKGILIVETLNHLDQVPDEFLLVTLPLKIKDGTGCPVRALALF
jgi:kynurenine formamidase